jgi:transcriptional regulator with XRE-family HTH domain
MPAPPIGTIGQTVVRNIQDLTEARGLSLRGLSDRLRAIGRPILPSVLHALSQGKRRVDADDLVALAHALGVNPASLLLPRDVPMDAEIEVTPEVRQRAWAVWAWADGRMPLPASQDGAATAEERFAREVDFARHARPAFSAHDQAEALFEVYELGDRIEAWRAEGDPVIRGALRDRVIRQARQVILKLEEELEDDDAAAQLREAARTLPAPAVDYAERPGE